MDDLFPVFTVKEFCVYAKISVSTLYSLFASGKGPKKISVGKRVLISRETGLAWLKSLEQAA